MKISLFGGSRIALTCHAMLQELAKKYLCIPATSVPAE